MIFSAQPCDSCSGLRVGNGYRTIITCPHLFGIKSLPILFVSCTPGCVQKLFLNANDNIPIPFRDTFIVNEKFISKLKTRQM
jgi:hypothetical protein